MAEYIDREALINAIDTSMRDNPHDHWFARKCHIAEHTHFLVMVDEQSTADVVAVRHGVWETVHGVLAPGGDPLKRCPYCKSRESEHLDGIEHPSRWMFCPICGAKMDGKGEGE